MVAEKGHRVTDETGITTRFVCASTLTIRPREICEALARLLQEALVNVRKHSDATQVLVRLDSWNGHWRLAIDDNDHGFHFSGCFSWADLEKEGRGPLVIKQYVRLIQGELTLDSFPERGSRLVITIPQRRRAGSGTALGLIQSTFIRYFRRLHRRFT
jgi:two-component system, NarL family, sensor histidine kinase DegS